MVFFTLYQARWVYGAVSYKGLQNVMQYGLRKRLYGGKKTQELSGQTDRRNVLSPLFCIILQKSISKLGLQLNGKLPHPHFSHLAFSQMGHSRYTGIWMGIEDQTPMVYLREAFRKIWPHLPYVHDFSLLCIGFAISSSFVFHPFIYFFIPFSLSSNLNTSSMKHLCTCTRIMQSLPSLCHLCSLLQCISCTVILSLPEFQSPEGRDHFFNQSFIPLFF